MCDYSLHNVKTRPARVGDRLTTRVFNITTRGFSAPEDVSVAVCVLPGTELSFTREVMRVWPQPVIHHETAVFRQINLDRGERVKSQELVDRASVKLGTTMHSSSQTAKSRC